MTDLSILIYKEGDLFVGQCLEHDLCVQSKNLDEIRRLMAHQVEFYAKHGGLEVVPRAPQEFFDDWEQTTGDPQPIILNGSGNAKAKMAA